MRSEQNAVLDSLRRAQQFLDTHGDVVGPVSASTRQQLDDVVTQLSAMSIAQDSGARGSKGETSKQSALRVALRRKNMVPIAEIAKFKLRDVPEFAALTLPRSNAAAAKTVVAAYAMADAASAHAQTFIDNGLPATFADDLRAAANEVGASIADRNKQQGRRTGATADLGAEDQRGRGILRVLNALIRARIDDDAGLLAEWASARTVRRKGGRVAGSQDSGATPIHSVPVSVTPTPAPTPVPAMPAVAVAA